jgi:hypothetical protein
MDAYGDDVSKRRAARRLLGHCAALDEPAARGPRVAHAPSALVRLDTLVGPDLARRLVFALSR